jgi:hypothetical protein
LAMKISHKKNSACELTADPNERSISDVNQQD